MSDKPIVFVITPFEEDYLALYDVMKARFAESFEFTNAGDLDNQQNILKDIVVGIYRADVIIADLTGLNSNVFYELGLAHAMNKKVIIITQDITELPFDIRSYRANQYSLAFHKIDELYTQLDKLLTGAISGDVQFGSPVSDFISDMPDVEKKKVNIVATENETKNIDEDSSSEEDKGFLDFIAEIDESMELITSTLEGLSNGMNAMSGEIENGTREVERVQLSGGAGVATFARNISRKLSQPVNIFATQIKEGATVVSGNWNNVENNYLLLLSDRKIVTDENSEDIKTNIGHLEALQSSIYASNEQMDRFINSMESCLGLERRLTQAIKALILGVQEYLSITNMMISSIDRIITKSKLLYTTDEC